MPSPLMSPTATENGFVPTGKLLMTSKVPSPLPSSTLTLLLPKLAVTMSGLPSPLTSPTATEAGAVPAVKLVAAPKVPSPLPSSTLTLLLPALATTRSGLPSPLTSADRHGLAIAYRWRSWLAAPKVPSPLPSSTLTLLPPKLATTRSGLPSPLTSPTATERGDEPTAKVAGSAEGAVAVAQQHAHGVAAVVGDDEVGLAVAVDVRDRHGYWVRAGGEVDRAAEGAVAVAEQHAHGVVVGAADAIGDDEVGLAVAVDVRDRHGKRSPCRR